MRTRRAFATLAATAASLLLIGAMTPLDTAAGTTRAVGILGWLGVGPRQVEDGFVGGISCNCSGWGLKECPARAGQRCDKYYSGCTASGGSYTKYCTSGGNYNYCGGDYCQDTGYEDCDNTNCY